MATSRTSVEALVKFQLVTGDIVFLRPELIGGIAIGPASAEVVITDFKAAYKVPIEEGHRLAEVLQRHAGKPLVVGR